ncbi:MAG: DNA adenine methylase [Chloroflexota bacterium]|nr:DNA adenine methylase [Chloroflexota bacterium]
MSALASDRRLGEAPAGRPAQARPFLKWAGGKGQLLEELSSRLPARFGRYFEPFVGGGALYFALHGAGRLRAGAGLSDANGKLIDTYRAVRDDVEAVIAHLSAFSNDRDLYYQVRAWRHEDLDPPRAAARIIFLNKTCYNGLFRENSRGEFNVPFGRYVRPTICDAPNLRAVATALRRVSLRQQDFGNVPDRVKPGDLVYFDPPYHPRSATSSFTQYSENGFGEDEQRRLARVVRELDARGAYVMLSNSDTPFIRKLYAGLVIDEVLAGRAINSKAARRGKVTELIVRNYGAAAPRRSRTARQGGSRAGRS